MRIEYDTKFIKKRVYFQIYTYGEYGIHTKQLWRWKGSCNCGVMYTDVNPVVVKKKMNGHMAMAHHEPGVYYTLAGRDKYLEALRQKNRSKA